MPRLTEPYCDLGLTLDGHPLRAARGETIAGMMLAHGQRIFRRTTSGAARGPYCGMGTCFDCRVEVTFFGQPPQMLRACATLVEDGMAIRTPTGGPQ